MLISCYQGDRGLIFWQPEHSSPALNTWQYFKPVTHNQSNVEACMVSKWLRTAGWIGLKWENSIDPCLHLSGPDLTHMEMGICKGQCTFRYKEQEEN